MERWLSFTALDGEPLLVREGSITAITSSALKCNECCVISGENQQRVRAYLPDLAVVLEAMIMPATSP